MKNKISHLNATKLKRVEKNIMHGIITYHIYRVDHSPISSGKSSIRLIKVSYLFRDMEIPPTDLNDVLRGRASVCANIIYFISYYIVCSFA